MSNAGDMHMHDCSLVRWAQASAVPGQWRSIGWRKVTGQALALQQLDSTRLHWSDGAHALRKRPIWQHTFVSSLALA